MKTLPLFTLAVCAAAGISCSTVRVTQVQPGRGGELAVQEGVFGEPARVKADRVMQDQCPQGYEIDKDADVVIGSVTTTESATEGKVQSHNIRSTTTSVAETHDKTERRISWTCKGASVSTPTAASVAPAAPVVSGPAAIQAVDIDVKRPTGWTTDIGLGRRWYKPQDTAVANFHSTALNIRVLYDLLPGVAVGGDLHVDGYDNDSGAANENFTSSLFELGVTTKLSHRFGVLQPYLVGNYYFVGEGNREYERDFGFSHEKYSGRNSSHGMDGALGLAVKLGDGSLYFEWYRSAERMMKVDGRLERQSMTTAGMPYTTVEGDKRSFKTRYDGFALGLSLPIRN